MNNQATKMLGVAMALVLVALFSLGVRAQQDGDLTQTREITSDVFTKKRPVAKKGPGKQPTVGKSAVRKKYKLVARRAPRRPKSTIVRPKKPSVVEQLGITLWRLRPEKTNDTGARILTMGGGERLVAERVTLDTVFHKNDKVRISIESPRSGYLYVVDRELKRDRSLGEAYLIFPTLKTRAGNNYVSAGAPVEIPAQTDEQVYWDISPNSDDYAGELLTVILSPTKIPNLLIGREPLKLENTKVEKWEASWENETSVFELDGSDVAQYTEEEKQAGVGTRQLTQNSPAPKSLVAVKTPKGDSFLISFALNVKK
jgi:hypothetical protein